MNLIEHIRPDVVILEPRERLTVENEGELQQVVRRHLDAGRACLVLNLGSVPYIDSCGLGTIAQTHLSAQRLGGWLKLLNVHGHNRQLLTVTRLLGTIGIWEPECHAASA
jgi:anti-anti-sigma factor